MIRIDLQPELEARIAAQAQARGLPLEQYIVEKLETSTVPDAHDQYAASEHAQRERAAQRDAAVEEMSQFAARHGFTHGDEEIRITAHEGHKY